MFDFDYWLVEEANSCKWRWRRKSFSKKKKKVDGCDSKLGGLELEMGVVVGDGEDELGLVLVVMMNVVSGLTLMD